MLEKVKQWRSEISSPSTFFVYRVLGTFEEQYAEGLRQEIVDAKPEVDEWFEMRWAPQQERWKPRERMYPIKSEARRYARDHAKEVDVGVRRGAEANGIVVRVSDERIYEQAIFVGW